MTDKPEPKDAKKDTKKDTKEPRPIIHLGMMGDRRKSKTSESAVIVRSASKEDEVDAAFNQPAPKKNGVGNRFG